jgi:hypothetical protein
MAGKDFGKLNGYFNRGQAWCKMAFYKKRKHPLATTPLLLETSMLKRT